MRRLQDDRGEKANDALPQRSLHQERESLSLFLQVLHFYKVAAAIKSFIFLSHAFDFASTQRIRSIIASKVARRAGGGGAPAVVARVDQRASLESSRPGFLSPACSRIDLDGTTLGCVRWEKITPAEVNHAP